MASNRNEHCDDSISVFPFIFASCARPELFPPLCFFQTPSFVMALDLDSVLCASYSRHESSGASSASAERGKQTSCPLCSRKTWAQQEQDLWRLERWLEHAENQFRAHERIPTNMEQLEDTVQDFRVCSPVRWELSGTPFLNHSGVVSRSCHSI